MHLFTTIDDRRLALDLDQIEAVMERTNGVQIITRSDTYMVLGDFDEIVAATMRTKEGKA